MSWSPTQYSKFEAERNRPIRDLLAQLPGDGVATAVDIGCGPGNSTELLAQRFPDAEVTGMDSSADMVESARKRLPGIAFEVADISDWSASGPYDVIFANAALQWVPDHESVFPALIAKLSEGGCLAVQMPDNLDEPAHRLMREAASSERWHSKLGAIAANLPPRHDALWYFDLLRDRVSDLDIWRTIYHHRLTGGPTAIVEWFKGTGLRPFIQPLTPEEQTEFLAKYEAALAKEYRSWPDGTVLLPFPRLFIVATR